MMDGFTVFDGGDSVLRYGVFKGRTYRSVYEDPDAKEWIEGILKPNNKRMPQYQVDFKRWVEEVRDRQPFYTAVYHMHL